MSLPSKLKRQVVDVIMQTGFSGNAEEYIRTFYGKAFDELTICEAEMIIGNLKDKEGCLFNTKEGGFDVREESRQETAESS